MLCLGFEPGVAGWKAQTNPLSNGGTLQTDCYIKYFLHTRLFSCYFSIFKETLQFFFKKNNVHPVFGVGIRTPHILNMNLPQKPLDQGSHPYMQKVVIKLSKRLYHFLSHFLSNTARLIQPSLIVGQRIQMFDSPALNLALNYTTPFSVSYNISCHILFRIKSSLIVG